MLNMLIDLIKGLVFELVRMLYYLTKGGLMLIFFSMVFVPLYKFVKAPKQFISSVKGLFGI